MVSQNCFTSSPPKSLNLVAAKRRSPSTPSPSFPMPEGASRVRVSSSPMSVDWVQYSNEASVPPDPHIAPSNNDLPNSALAPKLPLSASRVESDDGLLNFEPDDASTPAPPQQLTGSTIVVPSRNCAQTPEVGDQFPSSCTSSPVILPRRAPYPTIRTPQPDFDPQSQVTVDHDDEEVERMVTAPTPSTMSIASPVGTPQRARLVIKRNFLDDDEEMSDLSSLSSLADEEPEEPTVKLETPNEEGRQESSSYSQRGRSSKAKQTSTSAPSGSRKRKNRSSTGGDQPRKRRKCADTGKPRKRIVWPKKVDSECRVSHQNSFMYRFLRLCLYSLILRPPEFD